jgi:hypothetical protein
MMCDSGHLCVFESVVAVAFYSKMYQNNFLFYFLTIIFNISTSKWFENIKKILIWSKEKNKKNLNCLKNNFKTQK